MRIGIIGAGISGLAAGFRLARKGHHVEIFEREDTVGGLVSTFDLDGTRIERYYHFLCGRDDGYLKLCRDLGLASRIVFKKARTGFFYEGREFPLTTPLDLLRFTPIPLSQRIRFGLFALEARWREEWRQLDELAARPWLIDRLGQRAYDVIWRPLLALKFAAYHDRISAAWVWHRLHRVARSKGRHGFLEGGSDLLLDTLTARIRDRGGAIHTSRPVARVLADGGRVRGLQLADGEVFECDRVISTLPLPVLAGMLPEGDSPYAQALRAIEYIGVACVIFKLARPVTRNFWLNINDSTVATNGIIEYTNLNPLTPADGHIAYVPYYLATDHELYRLSDETIVRQSWDALRRVSPALNDTDLLAHRVFRSDHAQAICTTGFLNRIPDARAPIEGLHLLDSVYLYPEDRSQSGLILRALKCADTLCEDIR